MVKKKRRMPPHIVLPNGMWRFVKRGTKSVARKVSRRKKTNKPKRRVSTMARRRRAYTRSRRSSPRRGISLMKGIFPVGGLIGSVLIGAGVSALQARFLPQVIPYQGAAAGFAVGGIGGAAGALIGDMLGGNATTTGGVW